VVSAFDYRRLCAARGGRPRLLFIAHQRQILQQAQATFRQVLRDPDFGELLDGQTTPSAHDHLFAMIQTLHSRSLVAQLGGDYWQMAIVDEAHHVPAASFQAVVESLKPSILLGLTATPERLDGQSLSRFFDARPDGSPTYALRIWDALDQQLLCPFEYYATADGVDFSGVDWGKSSELTQVAQVLTGNELRARSVAMSIERYVDDLGAMKALAFCSSVDHARYMAEVFCKTGLPATAVSGEDSQTVRENAVRDLRSGRLQIICTVNLFNEGIDIPEVNTLFLLRPTQSPVVFQQQIGRGLRLHPGKSCCVVLDYIGVYGSDFRVDVLYRSLTGLNRRQLVEAADKGFGLLPPGCHLQLDKVTRERVLANLRQGLQLNARRLRAELAAWAAGRSCPLRLADFLRDQLLEAAELYENRRSWQGLLREAGLPHADFGPDDDTLLGRVGLLLHVNDPRLVRAWLDWLQGDAAPTRTVLMLAHQIFHERDKLVSVDELRQLLSRNPALTAELHELCAFLEENTDNPGRPMRAAPPEWPLSLHARYSRRQLLAAAGYATEMRRPAHREGVLALEEARQQLLFVTLDKRQGFTETVRYRDFAIAPERFAWETQNRAHPGNRLGKRYLESPGNGWRFFLFVREDPEHEFVALGEVSLERWEPCEQGPIPIVWKLLEPMSAELYRRFSVLRDT
jgi:superfamily II DNA or RNA helicase